MELAREHEGARNAITSVFIKQPVLHFCDVSKDIVVQVLGQY